MDLRIVKTKHQIKNAFLKLRNKYSPENIKVKDICDEAKINKTTFYKHYSDSMELANEIDDGVIESLVANFPHQDRFFENPREYLGTLLASIDKHSDLLRRVFFGKTEILCAKLEQRLKRFFEDKVKNDEESIMMSFAVGGFVQIIKDYLFGDTGQDAEKVIDYTLNIIASVIRSRKTIITI